MKNLTLLFVFLCLFSFGAFSQDNSHSKKFTFGVIAGLQPQGKMFNTDKWEKSSGFVAGVTGQYHFAGNMDGFSLLVQPHYNRFERFNQSDERGPGYSQWYTESNWKTESFNLPILVRYTAGKGIIRPFIEAGPNLKFRTALKKNGYRVFCGSANCVETVSNDNYQHLTGQDRIGLIISAGAEVNLWKVAIPVSLRLNEGFGTYATKGVMYDTPVYDNLKTRTFQIVTGVTF